MILYIGEKVAQQLGIRGGDRVDFHIEKTDPRIWCVKKSDDSMAHDGYKVFQQKNPSGKAKTFITIQITWKWFVPHLSEIHSHTVEHKIYKGGILINLNNPECMPNNNEDKPHEKIK